METSDKMQSRQIVFLFCHSFANNTKQYVYILFTPTLKLLHSTTPNKGAPWSPVPRQWFDAQYSVSELQPKYVPAAAQSVVELSMGRLSAMIITDGIGLLFVCYYLCGRASQFYIYLLCPNAQHVV